MKSLLNLFILMVGSFAYPQALVDFRNNNLPEPPDHRVRFPDGSPVIGTHFVAQLFYAPDAPAFDTALSAPAAVTEAPSRFRIPTTIYPGTWQGGYRHLIGTPCGESKMYVVRAWDSSIGDGSYQAAYLGSGLVGQSTPFEYTFSCAPLGDPTAHFINYFQGFTLVPEPSAFVLTAVGAMALTFASRLLTRLARN